MSTTLTNGLKLPDKGSVDWYADMQSNYAILDGAVGTVAEHTSQIAGKAPAVHTHTKADITDFPAYGNTAGTICEGNDSRLSDARTPVAHTHTKSDVTDLFNSANTWTGTNTFTAKNLYHIAKDPYNVLKSSTMQEGVVPSGDRAAYTGYWIDKNTSILGYGRFTFYSAGVQAYEVNLRNKATNGSFSPSGSQIQSGFQLALHSNGNSEFKIYAHTLPNGNGTWNLGDSTHKWKTLNDINPGALSLPDMDSTVSKSTELATAIDKTQTANSWTADFTGILRITWFVKNLTGPFRCSVCNNADVRYATWGQTFSANDVWYFIISFPVQNGKTYYFDNSFTRTSEDTAPIVYGASAVYCLGNV